MYARAFSASFFVRIFELIRLSNTSKYQMKQTEPHVFFTLLPVENTAYFNTGLTQH